VPWLALLPWPALRRAAWSIQSRSRTTVVRGGISHRSAAPGGALGDEVRPRPRALKWAARPFSSLSEVNPRRSTSLEIIGYFSSSSFCQLTIIDCIIYFIHVNAYSPQWQRFIRRVRNAYNPSGSLVLFFQRPPRDSPRTPRPSGRSITRRPPSYRAYRSYFKFCCRILRAEMYDHLWASRIGQPMTD
jgi:hypothetical protein